MGVIRVGVLGFGGLGQAAAMVLHPKQEMQLVAVADRGGWAYRADGLPLHELLSAVKERGTVAALPEWGHTDSDGIAQVMTQAVDGFFLALPNLPNTFMARVAQQFIRQGWQGVLVDAIKRTSAVEQLLLLHPALQQTGITYLTGCGATPGLLTAAAVLASQSFAEVLTVKITFGVGIASWEQYRSTIREDIGHLPDYTLEQARAMSDAEVEQLLARTGGLLHLENMEHADDILLERLGICSRDQVTVGGVVDTRNPKKPLSTNVQVTGRTFEGRTATHTFTLGDETSMAANVCGPAFGYLKAGVALQRRGSYGLFTSAEVMPGFVR
ncbi:saccharopine dehydrogenase-like oxidoreductase [Candidatus Cyanaurora vandensis]|uniref:saccharopine dehydrogenase-like oxidoreductase n=1 Tax=Candidatus Cyanaurora vandensis TaxID=2714958 RepID=UPI00257E8ADA|nr:saccharopine dehydrogenase-like oxidoreductase [Candidatus Cyanaurora vandensis]